MRGRCVDKEQVKSQQADGRGAKGSLWALSIKDGLEYPGASFLEEAILEDRTHSQSTRTQAFKYLCLTTDVSSQMSHHEGMSRRIIPFTQYKAEGGHAVGPYQPLPLSTQLVLRPLARPRRFRGKFIRETTPQIFLFSISVLPP